MENFNLTKNTNFWVYVTTSKLWTELENHLQNSQKMFISTFKYPMVTNDGVLLVYIKGKALKVGFACVMQVKGDRIDNSSGEIKIFTDLNLNAYCYQIETVVFLPSLIKIDDIVTHLDSIESFKNKKSFSGKYLRFDSIFNQIDNDLGSAIMGNLFKIVQQAPAPVPNNKNTRKQKVEGRGKQGKKKKEEADPNEINQGKHEVDPNEIDNSVCTGNVPVMVVLCQAALNKLVSEPDNEPNIVYDHLMDCNQCDVTDNGDIKVKLISRWSTSDISYLEVDSKQDEYTSSINAYHNIKRHNPFGDVDKCTIRLLNIIELGNTYNDCMILESYFPENMQGDKQGGKQGGKQGDKGGDKQHDNGYDKQDDKQDDKRMDNGDDKQDSEIESPKPKKKSRKILVRGKN
jgi:hypothetical protein